MAGMQLGPPQDYRQPLHVGTEFTFLENGMPVFEGISEEDHSGTWTTLQCADARVQWHKAAVAVSLHEKYQAEGVLRFCGKHNVKASHVYQLIRTYKRFLSGKCTQVQSLPFSHHRTVSYVKDEKKAQEWLEKADDESWTSQRLQVEIRKDEARQRLANSPDPDLEEECLYWESTVRPVLYRYMEEYKIRRQMIMSWIDEGNDQFGVRVMSKPEMVLQKLEEGCKTAARIASEMGWTKDMAQVLLDDLEKEKKIHRYKPEKTTKMARGAVTPHYKVGPPPDPEPAKKKPVTDDEDDDF